VQEITYELLAVKLSAMSERYCILMNLLQLIVGHSFTLDQYYALFNCEFVIVVQTPLGELRRSLKTP